jgi:RNA polymerase sigma-70 factor (ECF subfamily)
MRQRLTRSAVNWLVAAAASLKTTDGFSLATQKEFSEFLAGVERRAYKQALFAVRDEHTALDVVQDAMTKLVENYAQHPPAELPPLFQRILQNTIHDHFRRQNVRTQWTPQASTFATAEDDERDAIEALEARSIATPEPTPADQLQQSQTFEIIEQALQELPARQREAFLLRYWEELDVAETAAAMGCSQGSVKTHCSRATHALSAVLKAKGITL